MGKVRIAPAAALPAGQAVRIDIDGQSVALFNVEGVLHAVDDECLHMGASLSTGSVHDGLVVCPWHAWCYDLATGARVGRRGSPLRTYPVSVEDQWITLEGV